MKSKILFSSIIFIIAIALVSSIPYPHNLKGTATHLEGENIPDGYLITAGINGIISGQSIVSDGKYELTVTSELPGKIEFFVNGEKMDQEFQFTALEITDLNLTIDEAPENTGSCGDGVCGTGECSFCLIDCNIGDCTNDGTCDIMVGESCFNSPEDCGACCGNGVCDNIFGEDCNSCSTDCGSCTTNNNGGSTSSGGGGGGSSSSSSGSGKTTPQTTNNSNDKNSDDSLRSIKDLNEETESFKQSQEITTEKPKGFFSFITGGVIGTSGGASLLIVLIIIIALVIFVLIARKKNSQKDIHSPSVKITPVTKSTTKKTSKKNIVKKQ